jgi:soluble lytic murein transglycosylase-like protein
MAAMDSPVRSGALHAGVGDFISSSRSPAIKIYKYKGRGGVTEFSDQAPPDRRYEVLRYDCYACNPASRIDWHKVRLYLQPFHEPVARAAAKYAVDPALVRAVIHAESAFRPEAISSKGAIGLMQLMPATAVDMGVADPRQPEQNIDGGVRYLAYLLKLTEGNIRLATAAYNAGPAAVKRHNGIPPYAETRTYVERVGILHGRYREALTQVGYAIPATGL